MKIDVVIPWVDGNDPVLNAKRAQYGDKSVFSRPDVGGDTRYSDLGEIHYCIRSLNRFAPFINRIFIVTDGQDPHVESDIPVEIIDHKLIFRDYLEYLPVFNSSSIETLIWNIPQLSEHFLLMNDDFVLIKPVRPSDFFTEDGTAVCYGRLYSTLWAKFLYKLSVIKHGYRRSTFKVMLMNGCRIAGMKRRFFYLVHTPRPMLKSVYENFYASHSELIERNVSHRFRSVNHYQSQGLHYAVLYGQGKLVIRKPSRYLMFIQHWNGVDYVRSKLKAAAQAADCKFACFNSLDLASDGERREVFNWLEETL